MALEYAVEMTYPLPEGTSFGLLNVVTMVSCMYVFSVSLFIGGGSKFRVGGGGAAQYKNLKKWWGGIPPLSSTYAVCLSVLSLFVYCSSPRGPDVCLCVCFCLLACFICYIII